MIYLDNHATTRTDPRVVEAMLPYFTHEYGNPGSLHALGQSARDAVAAAQTSIAAAINAAPEEIVFTSGATESNNLALRGLAEHQRRRGNHLVSVRTEHRAVLDPLARLARRGYEVTLLDVEQQNAESHDKPRAGWLDPQRVADALRPDTAVVSVMLANNEIGVIQPIADIAEVCRAAGVPLHCDATQAVGKIPVDVAALGVDLMSFTAHKLFGPKGVGALYVRRTRPALRLDPQITGGGQQHGLRSGTLNVPAIIGFARALELCLEEMPTEAPRLANLRSSLWTQLSAKIDNLTICGPGLEQPGLPNSQLATHISQLLRLPHNLNVAFNNVDGEALMLAVPELAVSSGAACSSTDPAPSHVLLALGMTEDAARSTLRFGLGRFTTAEEIQIAAKDVAAAVKQLRALA